MGTWGLVVPTKFGQIRDLYTNQGGILRLLQTGVASGGGADYAYHSTTSPPGFSDLPTALLIGLSPPSFESFRRASEKIVTF